MAVHEDGLRVANEQPGGSGRSDLVSVTHVDRYATDSAHNFGREPRIARRVSITGHRAYRCDQTQLIEYRITAHVSRVQNQLDALQRGVDVRSHLAVRVGDEPDDVDRLHRYAVPCPALHLGTTVCGTPR